MPESIAHPGRANAAQMAEAIASALTAREGSRSALEVAVGPHGLPSAAFNLECAAGRFIVVVAERP